MADCFATPHSTDAAMVAVPPGCAGAIMSSPLILSFNLSDPARMERAWPIISNTRILAVNQRWAGSPGRRITMSAASGFQAWAKPMDVAATSWAIFFLNGGSRHVHASLPLPNVSSAAFSNSSSVCLRDLYSGSTSARPLPSGAPIEAALPAHDSALYCAWPSAGHGTCAAQPHSCP